MSERTPEPPRDLRPSPVGVATRCSMKTRLQLAIGSLVLLGGCENVELFRVAGYAQEDFSNDADILFLIDNSDSMQDEAAALGLNFDRFVRELTANSGSTNGLSDAVDNYVRYVQSRTSVVDFQLAITTTDVSATYGDLYGSPRILNNDTEDVSTAFNRNLLCEATCFLDSTAVASDSSYVCTDPPAPPGAELTTQYLNCLCGENQWEGHCGSGNEEHLEAIFMAMCRASDDPPADCFENNQFDESTVGSNAGLIRENSTFIPVIVTDEGDTSRRMSQGDGEPDEYADLFNKFDTRMAFAVIGPTTDNCNSANATRWGVARYEYFVTETGGSYFPIAAGSGEDCGVSDFETAMSDLGQLMSRLVDAFTLQSVPDVDTLRVFVDGRRIEPADETEQADGSIAYTDGWTYQSERNAIRFHGAAVPGYNAQVRIYYRPLEGMPRELPFADDPSAASD